MVLQNLRFVYARLLIGCLSASVIGDDLFLGLGIMPGEVTHSSVHPQKLATWEIKMKLDQYSGVQS